LRIRDTFFFFNFDCQSVFINLKLSFQHEKFHFNFTFDSDKHLQIITNLSFSTFCYQITQCCYFDKIFVCMCTLPSLKSNFQSLDNKIKLCLLDMKIQSYFFFIITKTKFQKQIVNINFIPSPYYCNYSIS
jgi:hypothetical protein